MKKEVLKNNRIQSAQKQQKKELRKIKQCQQQNLKNTVSKQKEELNKFASNGLKRKKLYSL